MFIYDIETAANEQAEAYYDRKEYTPDSALNGIDEYPTKVTELKNEELRNARMAEWRENQIRKIEASIQTKRRADEDKAALYWWTGKVVCICTQDDDGLGRTFNDLDESKLLRAYFSYLTTSGHRAIGKSSNDFDKPFLIGRAMHHDIGIPNIWRPLHQIEDINQIFSYNKQCSQISSLSNYAWGLSLDEKKGHGSEVAEWYKAGDHAKIEEYCQHDVQLTFDIFKRWEKPFEL